MLRTKDKTKNIKRIAAFWPNFKIKGKTAGNIIKESILHPLSTTTIDLSSGDVIEKKRNPNIEDMKHGRGTEA